MYGTTEKTSALAPERPVIYDLSIQESTATSGEIINISLNISTLQGNPTVYIKLYAPETTPGGGPIELTRVDLVFDIDLSLWIGTYTIDLYDPATIGIGELAMYESSVSFNWFNENLFPSMTYTFSSALISVTGTLVDNNAPVLNNISFNSSIITQNQRLRVSVDAYDDGTGIDFVALQLYRDTDVTTNNFRDDKFITSFNLEYKIANGLYEVDIFFYQYFPSDNYYIGVLSLYDKAGNYIDYVYDPSSTNYFNSPIVTYNNIYYEPIFSELFYKHQTVDQISSQTLYFKINSFGSGFSYGTFQLAYFPASNPDGLGVASFTVQSSDFNASTGYYQYDLRYGNIFNEQMNSTIYLSDVNLYQVNGESFSIRRAYDEMHTTFSITGEIDKPITIGLTGNGTSNVQESFDIEIVLNNYYDSEIEGTLSVNMTGPENLFFVVGDYVLPSLEEITIIISEVLYAVGNYTISAIFTTNQGERITDTINWSVLGEEIGRSLDVQIDPSSGNSVVNEEVRFDIVVNNTIDESENIFVTLLFIGPEIMQEDITLTISPYEIAIITLMVEFTTIGFYEYNVTVQDQLGYYYWTDSYTWEVLDRDQPDEPDDPSNPSNTTDPLNPSNSTELPDLSLPGFELELISIGMFLMVALVYTRRKMKIQA